VVDFSQAFPGNTDWRGPTAVVRHGDSLYVGTLTPFPTVVGAANIFKVDPQTGQFSMFAAHLTTVLGLTFGRDGNLYVLESMPVPGFPGPADIGAGQVVRIDPSGTPTPIFTGLSFPSAMTFGPDDNLYVSDHGFGFPPGQGQVLKIAVNNEAGDD
jgi:sugar lactone lactonase YvrE